MPIRRVDSDEVYVVFNVFFLFNVILSKFVHAHGSIGESAFGGGMVGYQCGKKPSVLGFYLLTQGVVHIRKYI